LIAAADSLRLGVALEQEGRTLEACSQYLHAMRVDPTHPLAQYRACRLLARLAEIPEQFLTRRTLEPRAERSQWKPRISVVICSIDPGKFARVSSGYEHLLEGYPHEIVGIHDARSMCEGYNRGFAQTTGEIVIFSHDDIEIVSAGFAEKLAGLFAQHDIIGVAGASGFPDNGLWAHPRSPYAHGVVAHRAPGEEDYATYVFGVGGALDEGMQVLDGVFFAARRRVVEAIGFDARTFDGFHFYDIDFTYRAFLAGFRIAVSNEMIIVHQSRGKFGDEWRRYADLFLAKHSGAKPHSPPTHRFWHANIVRLGTTEQVVEFARLLVATADAARNASQEAGM